MQCPFCKETIQDGAIKCRHCGSMLNAAPQMPQQQFQPQQNIQQQQPHQQQQNFQPQQNMQQAEFNLQQNEQVHMEGVATYVQSALKLVTITCYVTNYRLVVCGNSWLVQTLIGPFMAFLPFLGKSKKIMFQIYWNQISNVEKAKHGLSEKLIFKTNSGQDYAMMFGVGAKKEQWFSMIRNTSKFSF